MKTKIISAILSFMIFAFACTPQYYKGNKDYNRLSYAKAIKHYNRISEKDMSPEVKMKLADSYRLNSKFDEAETWYAKVVDLPEAQPIHYLRYAEMLMSNKKYEESRRWFSIYLIIDPYSTIAASHLNALDSLDKFSKDAHLYLVTEEIIDSTESNFSPTFYKDGLVFCTDRNSDENLEDGWTGDPFYDLFIRESMSKDDNDKVYMMADNKINSKYHEGPASFTNNDNMIYFTRNNYYKKGFLRAEEDVAHLKIFSSKNQDDDWLKALPVEFDLEDNFHPKDVEVDLTKGGYKVLTSKSYSTNYLETSEEGFMEEKIAEAVPFDPLTHSSGHPTLTKSGKLIFYISDMPGGYGGTDIYLSTIRKDGRLSRPINVGPSINTEGNEMFPYIFEDSLGNYRLYFASNGHFGLGGLDIFSSNFNAETAFWEDPIPMSYPVNSPYDDFGLIVNPDEQTGYFSSNRTNSNGVDGIYKYTTIYPDFYLEATVINSETKEPIEFAVINMTSNKETSSTDIFTTDSIGQIFTKLDYNSSYSLYAHKIGFHGNYATVSTYGLTESDTLRVVIPIDPLEVGKTIVLKNIYYDFDKANIRPDAALELDKLVKTMRENPGLSIELSSHTDARGSDEYNERLSQRRAESAVQYIVSKDINNDRLIAKGYGEYKPVNECVNGVECSEEKHQDNRRTEFTVLENKNVDLKVKDFEDKSMMEEMEANQ